MRTAACWWAGLPVALAADRAARPAAARPPCLATRWLVRRRVRWSAALTGRNLVGFLTGVPADGRGRMLARRFAGSQHRRLVRRRGAGLPGPWADLPAACRIRHRVWCLGFSSAAGCAAALGGELLGCLLGSFTGALTRASLARVGRRCAGGQARAPGGGRGWGRARRHGCLPLRVLGLGEAGASCPADGQAGGEVGGFSLGVTRHARVAQVPGAPRVRVDVTAGARRLPEEAVLRNGTTVGPAV